MKNVLEMEMTKKDRKKYEWNGMDWKCRTRTPFKNRFYRTIYLPQQPIDKNEHENNWN